MLDNFETIKQIMRKDLNDLPFTSHFYLIQLIQRNKDGNEHHGVKASYIIRSVDELENLEEEIKLLSKFYNARAYITIAPKSMKSLQTSMLIELAKDIQQENIRSPKRLITHVASLLKSNLNRWLIDVDNNDNITIREQIDIIKEVLAKINYNGELIEIPSVNGTHLITSDKFNTMQFKELLIAKNVIVDVKKNDLTILYKF